MHFTTPIFRVTIAAVIPDVVELTKRHEELMVTMAISEFDEFEI